MTKIKVAPKNRLRIALAQHSKEDRNPGATGAPDHDDLDSSTAFEELRQELVDVEALATAADAALEALPFQADPERRRAIGRLHTLVAVTAATATAALDQADESLARLDRQSRPMSAARAGKVRP
jgi:hypothetical protein